MAPLTILLADDHPVVRQGLKTFLDLQPDLQVVGEAATGAEAVAQAEELRPDVVLLDLVMPDVGGIEAAGRIRAECPETKVIVLTSYADDENVLPALKAGASGYLLKDVEPAELADVDGVEFRDRGQHELKGLTGRHQLFEVVWRR